MTARVRWTDWFLSLPLLRLALWVTIVTIVFPGWLTQPHQLMEYMDDHQHHALDLVGYKSFVQFHQIPLWNPWWCGGTVGLAEPESTFLAPDFLLKLAFGVARGRHLAPILGIVMGLEGMFRLCRKFDASTLGAVFGATVYATQIGLITFVHEGALNLQMGFELIPWVLYCFYEGEESVPHRLLGGFFTAWIFLCAGTYPTPFLVLVLFLLTLLATGEALGGPRPRTWIKPWKSLVTIGFVSLLLSAIKLFPLISFLRQFKRVWNPVESHTPQLMFTELSTNYPWLLVVAFLGLLFLDRAAARFVGLAAFFFLLSMGDFDPRSPYHLLKQLPLLSQLRAPERYTVLVILFLSVAASRGWSRVEDAFPILLERIRVAFRVGPGVPRRPAGVLVSGLMVGASLLTAVGLLYPRARNQVLERVITADSLFLFEAPLSLEQPFRQMRGNRRDIHLFNKADGGSLRCILGIPIPQSPALRADLPQEEFPLDPSAATVRRLRWTPNAIDLQVDASRETLVVINQNWNRRFRASVGKVVNHQGLLAVQVPPGSHRLEIRFVDRLFQVSAVVSALTFGLLLVYAGIVLAQRLRVWVARARALPAITSYGEGA